MERSGGDEAPPFLSLCFVASFSPAHGAGEQDLVANCAACIQASAVAGGEEPRVGKAGPFRHDRAAGTIRPALQLRGWNLAGTEMLTLSSSRPATMPLGRF